MARCWCRVYVCWLEAVPGSEFCASHRFSAGEVDVDGNPVRKQSAFARVPAGRAAPNAERVAAAVAAIREVSELIGGGAPTANDMRAHGYSSIVANASPRRLGLSWSALVAEAGFAPRRVGRPTLNRTRLPLDQPAGLREAA